MKPFNEIWTECQIQHQSILKQRTELQAQRWDKNSKTFGGAFAWIAGLIFAGAIFAAVLSGKGNETAKGGAAVLLVLLVVAGLFYYLSKPEQKAETQLNLNWLDFYQEHGSPILLLVRSFFPFLDWQKNPAIVEELKADYLHSPLGGSWQQALAQNYIYQGQTNGAKLELLRFVHSKSLDWLLIRIQKPLNCPSALFVKSAAAFWNLAQVRLPEELNFGYFPELERFFNFYGKEKAQAAEFLQRNEDLFMQLFDYQDYPIRLVISNNELRCFWSDYEAGLWQPADEEIQEDRALFEAYYTKLERLHKLLDILLRMS